MRDYFVLPPTAEDWSLPSGADPGINPRLLRLTSTIFSLKIHNDIGHPNILNAVCNGVLTAPAFMHPTRFPDGSAIFGRVFQ